MNIIRAIWRRVIGFYWEWGRYGWRRKEMSKWYWNGDKLTGVVEGILDKCTDYKGPK